MLQSLINITIYDNKQKLLSPRKKIFIEIKLTFEFRNHLILLNVSNHRKMQKNQNRKKEVIRRKKNYLFVINI